MISNNTIKGASYQELAQSVQILAHVEPTHSPLFTCYLDMRQGPHTAKGYLAAKHREISTYLSDYEQHEFDLCYENILNELDSDEHDCEGLALFSRSYQGGHFFHTVKLDTAPVNQLSVSDIPDFIPLMLLLHEHGQFLLASISEGAIDICEISLGNNNLLGMAPLPEFSSEESRVAIATHMLERTMRSNPKRDVIVDGELEFIHAIYRTLPRLLRRRIIQLIPRKPGDTKKKIHKVGNLMHKRHREHEAHQRFNEIVKSGQALERLTTGITGCLAAISSRSVSALYLSADDLDLRAGAESCCWNEKTVLGVVRLAVQQSLPIEFIGSSKMMHLAGGVACMISQNAHMHQSSYQPRQDLLEMVA